jgi:deazaflavin-dependent oxidoreductase (nitroreductase family)
MSSTPDRRVIEQLTRIRTVDLTTIGRRTGAPSRIEIWWFRVDGRFLITGTPGARDWYANALAHPNVVIHTVIGDFDATATPVTDHRVRRAVFNHPDLRWYSDQAGLEDLVRRSPMVAIDLAGEPTRHDANLNR